MGKALVVILNKDNAEGLKNVLNSLVNQTPDYGICKYFDVLVVDGGSKDPSSDVVKLFRDTYPCIEFKVQEVLGGVGPARLEAIKYALNNGYEYIIWGDSENIYKDDYVSKILSSPKDCEVVSGKPLIICENLFEKLFYWYHAYHVIFSYVRKRHAPGNNKLVKTSAYSKSLYPPISRSDDFYFSVIALKKGVKFCYNEDALVTVALPNNWGGVKSWQRARMLGSLQGAAFLNMRFPPDFMPWFLFSLYPAYMLTSCVLMLTSNLLGYLLILPILTATLYLILKLFRLSKKVCLKNCLINPIAAFIGMYLHSLFTTYYTLRYSLKFSRSEVRKELLERISAIMGNYNLKLFHFHPSSKHFKKD